MTLSRRMDRLEAQLQPKGPPVIVVLYGDDPTPAVPPGTRVILFRFDEEDRDL